MKTFSLPKTVTNVLLMALAQPHEMWLVRILLRHVVNRSDYIVRGKNKVARIYKAKYDETLRCHTIDIPMSLWSEGTLPGSYRDNDSLMHDIMGGRSTSVLPIITQIVPFPGSESRHIAFEDYLRKLDERKPGDRKPVPKKHGIQRKGTPVNERMRQSRERAKQRREASAAAALLATPAVKPENALA